MPIPEPQPLIPRDQRARQRRADRIAKQLGFVGGVEYRHVYSQTGGAQYEEILASLLGAMICDLDADRVTLFAKAAAELLDRGQNVESANRQLQELWGLLEALL